MYESLFCTMSSIITEYSLWFLFGCIAIGLIYAWLLYRKENKLEEAPFLVLRSVFIFRFIVVSILAFLLLKPLIKITGKTVENPMIIFAIDNSESVASDSKSIENIVKPVKNHFENNKDKFDFMSLSFGERVTLSDTFNLNEKESDMSELLINVNERMFHRNAGALILVSDGIVTGGENPLNEAKQFKIPIYTIALGDTNIQADSRIFNAETNNIAFLNNSFPVNVTIKADKLSGKKSRIKILDNGKTVYQKQISISSDTYFKKFEFQLNAKETGFHKIDILLDSIEGESNYGNNVQVLFIEVADSKQKVLILGNSPHPDISAIRRALELNQNFETEFYTIQTFNKSVKAYNLVILHQIPSKTSSPAILSSIINSNVPLLFILGQQTSTERFDNLNIGLRTGAYSNNADLVNGILNKNFSLFDIDEQTQEILSESPPIISPFGSYELSSDSEVLFFRKIKTINTELPLMVFTSLSSNRKNCVITGEGIWRWSMYDYKKNKNNYLFNDLINKTIQYLTEKDIKEYFTVRSEKIIAENQAVIFNATLFNENYEALDNAEIRLKIVNSEGETRSFVFEAKNKDYYLQIEPIPVGDYTWTAETVYNGRVYEKDGILTVIPLNIETNSLQADHNLLFKIAEQTGGQLLYPNEIEKLKELINNNENIVPVSFSEKKTESIVNYKIIFALLLVLLSLEWFARKFYGSY